MTRTYDFNLTGSARKPLIEAIGEFTRVKGVYQGPPKYGYVFLGFGVLDKNGALHLDCDMQVIMDLITWLENCGFICESPTEETEDPAFEELQMTEREEMGLGRERRDYPGEDGMQASDVPEQDEPFDEPDHAEVEWHVNANRLIIEISTAGFTTDKIENLNKMVNAKAPLLKAALETDELPIIQTAETLQFPWFNGNLEAEQVEAYTTLVCLMCRTAREKKRVTAREKDYDGSPKFAMRCFLLSLGFIGAEYKTARKILLSKLEGNSSWKNGAPEKNNESGAGSDE